MGDKSLKDHLACFMDPEAFRESVPVSVKYTCKGVAKVQHDKLKFRRDIAKKRADAAIRFFMKPENRAKLDHRIALTAITIEARSGETGTGSTEGKSAGAQPIAVKSRDKSS